MALILWEFRVFSGWPRRRWGPQSPKPFLRMANRQESWECGVDHGSGPGLRSGNGLVWAGAPGTDPQRHTFRGDCHNLPQPEETKAIGRGCRTRLRHQKRTKRAAWSSKPTIGKPPRSRGVTGFRPKQCPQPLGPTLYTGPPANSGRFPYPLKTGSASNINVTDRSLT